MTAPEDRISRMLGDKTSCPIVGLSSRLPGVVFALHEIDLNHNKNPNGPVVIEVRDRLYDFDTLTASWRPGPFCNVVDGVWTVVVYAEPACHKVWSACDEAGLQRLRSM